MGSYTGRHPFDYQQILLYCSFSPNFVNPYTRENLLLSHERFSSPLDGQV